MHIHQSLLAVPAPLLLSLPLSCCAVPVPDLPPLPPAQTDISRKRLRALSHLPLTGTFLLAEVALAPLLPPEALAPFAEELAARDKRRKRRVADERWVLDSSADLCS